MKKSDITGLVPGDRVIFGGGFEVIVEGFTWIGGHKMTQTSGGDFVETVLLSPDVSVRRKKP